MREAVVSQVLNPNYYIDFPCVIWGATSQYNLDRTLRLQKYAARVTLNIKRPQGVPSSERFSKLNHKSTCRLFCVHNDE